MIDTVLVRSFLAGGAVGAIHGAIVSHKTSVSPYPVCFTHAITGMVVGPIMPLFIAHSYFFPPKCPFFHKPTDTKP